MAEQTQGLGALAVIGALGAGLVLMLDANGTLPAALQNLGKSLASLRPGAAPRVPKNSVVPGQSGTIAQQTNQLIAGNPNLPSWQVALFGPAAGTIHGMIDGG